MYFQMLVVLYFYLEVGISMEMTAYDCQSTTGINLTMISLQDIEKCPHILSDCRESQIKMQVIQRPDIKTVSIKGCQAIITRSIYHCGFLSHSSVVSNGMLTYAHKINKKDCLNTHKYRTITLFPENTIGNLKINSTLYSTLTIAGQLKSDGSCAGTTYIENNYKWENVVVTATIELKLYEYEGQVTLNDNTVHLQNQVQCSFLNQYCFDPEFGTVIWDAEITHKCEKSYYDVLYEGNVNIITVDNSYNKETTTEYAVIEDEAHVFALLIRKGTMICGQAAYMTEHPRILLIPSRASGFVFSKSNSVSPQNLNLLAYINSKFLYVEVIHKQAIHLLHIHTVHRRCLLEKQLLHQQLLLARIAPDLNFYEYTNEAIYKFPRGDHSNYW